MSEDQLPHLGNNSRDRLTSGLRAILGAAPFAGAALGEVVSNIIPEQRLDRLVKYIELLEERVKGLEAELLHERFTSPEGVDILEDSFHLAIRAYTHERTEYIANVVANGFMQEEIDYSETKRMLWLLGQLSDVEVIVLRGTWSKGYRNQDSEKAFQDKHKAILFPDPLCPTMSEKQRREVILISSYNDNLVALSLLTRVYRQDLTREIPDFNHATRAMEVEGHEITTLGMMLLDYLEMIPEWASKQHPY